MTYLDLLFLYRKTIAAAMAVWIGVGIAIVLFAAPWYEAEAKFVIQSGQLGMATNGGLGEGIGALGGLIGLDMAGQNAEKTTRLEVLRSRTLALQFIYSHGLLSGLYEDEWDAERNAWNVPPRGAPPSEQEIFEIFDNKIRELLFDPRTGVGVLKMRWKDASVAATWVADFIRLADQTIRESDRSEITEIMNHLVRQMADQPQPEVKNSLATILEGYLRQNALIEARSEYALKTIDHPIDSLKPYWPNPMMVMVGSLILGLSTGLAIAFASALIRGERQRRG